MKSWGECLGATSILKDLPAEQWGSGARKTPKENATTMAIHKGDTIEFNSPGQSKDTQGAIDNGKGTTKHVKSGG